MSDRPITLNLGAGVQSTALLLMAATGDLEPMPDVAVFADTGDEPTAVYEHLAWLENTVTVLTLGRLKIIRTTAGNLGNDLIAAANGTRPRASNPPLFTVELREGANGRAPTIERGLLPRGCTRDYKIRPIRKALRELGYGPRNPVTTWLGLSWDELERVKPSDTGWQDLAYPLIDRRLTRHDCITWLADHGYPEPPRSACVYCPHHSNAEWRRIRDTDPAGWARALEVDAAIRTGLPGLRGDAYLHRDAKPLDEVDLDTAEDRGQLTLMDECEGGCFL